MPLRYYISDNAPVVELPDGSVYMYDRGKWRKDAVRLLDRYDPKAVIHESHAVCSDAEAAEHLIETFYEFFDDRPINDAGGADAKLLGLYMN